MVLLLGFMMSESKKQAGVNVKNNASLTTEEIIDECKTFYFAGHETTAVVLTWCIILLGIHQNWQERGRKEVLEVCGKNKYPDADSLSRLKIVGMIINEVLRLYPPLVYLLREACKPTKLGRLSIPAGTQIELPILAIHHDPALWGNDANDFNPGRFSEGVAKAAKLPMAFMPLWPLAECRNGWGHSPLRCIWDASPPLQSPKHSSAASSSSSAVAPSPAFSAPLHLSSPATVP